jgi:NAD-dependent deacetylase
VQPFVDHIARIASAVRAARRIAVLTGAGMSADSGLPTYRGIGGLYNAVEVEAGMPIEDILHAQTLARNPALTWKYLALVEQACRGRTPHQGHRILAAWEARCDVCVVTQNVDGFHRDAGSSNVVELHGNLRHLRCCDCRVEFALQDFDLRMLPPRCTHCDGLVRPDVVLFGELLPPAALARYEHELACGFDVMFAIGTTAAFAYIHQPLAAAAARGCVTIEINPDETVLSALVQYRLSMGARDALMAIDAALRNG